MRCWLTGANDERLFLVKKASLSTGSSIGSRGDWHMPNGVNGQSTERASDLDIVQLQAIRNVLQLQTKALMPQWMLVTSSTTG